MVDRKTRMSGRLDEMSHGHRSLRIEIQYDGDVVVFIEQDGVPIQDKDGNKASVEFCTLTAGGGRSPHTRKALFALFEAMKLDAKEMPDGIPPYPFHLAEAMCEDSENQ